MGYKQYCKDYENIENYDKAKADNFLGWCCHHRLETHNSDGQRRIVDITQKELKALGMYYNRPASELIFMKHGEHTQLHSKGKKYSEETKKKIGEAQKGKKLSEETRKKISEASKGKTYSEETRKKLSDAHKGKKFSAEHKKKLSEVKKGKHLTEETKKKISEAQKNMSEETKKKMSEARKGENNQAYGKHWYNNGKENKFCHECPPGFVPGMLR